jgi:16S rRNA (guanine527-N7)-methyltransferase
MGEWEGLTMNGTEDEATLPQMMELWQQTLNWQPNAEQLAQFQRLYQLVVQGNRQLNLTRITDPQEFWEKHLWDSLRGVQPWLDPEHGQQLDRVDQQNKSASLDLPASFQGIDIGTGAGFPGLPMAIACPDWTLTLLDSTHKKIAFLETLLTTLSIQNARTLAGRVEQIGQHPQHRGQYDLALLRAVAAAPVCAEYALPLLKLGGTAILYRGQWTEAETIALQAAIGQLGGELERIEEFVTPISQGKRHCVYLKKVAPTAIRFPRAVGVPTQQPL